MLRPLYPWEIIKASIEVEAWWALGDGLDVSGYEKISTNQYSKCKVNSSFCTRSDIAVPSPTKQSVDIKLIFYSHSS